MEARIAGTAIDVAQFDVRGRGFGREEAGQALVDYELRVSMPELVRAFGKFYRDYADDDVKFGESDEAPLVLELRAAGWPPLEMLARLRPDLLQAFLCDAAYDLLAGLAALTPRGQTARYFANEVGEAHLEGGGVVLRGRAIDATAEGR